MNDYQEDYKDGLCTVLVSSCDAYDDLWYPFFTILKKQWPELSNYNIVLNTESKSYHYEGLHIKCFELYSVGKKITWGKRLIETLERIDSKYIIFLLDDFFLTDRVDQSKIDKCVDYLEKDNNISVFQLHSTFDKRGVRSKDYAGFELRSKDGKWRLNTQAAIWRREKLVSYIRPHESAWDWEVYGSERSRRYTEDFYVLSEEEKSVFSYEAAWGGAIHRGKWTPYAVVLCNQYGIDIDFEIRGYETQKPPFDKPEYLGGKRGIKELFRPPFINRLYNYIHMWLVDYPRASITKYRSLR